MRASSKSFFARFNPFSALLIAAIFGIAANAVNAAALYKWIDENGQIRYSDRLPVSQTKKKHHQLNSQGVVVTTKEAARSKKELADEAEAKRLQDEEDARNAVLKRAQAEKDRVLIMTFSSEAELGLARNDRIEVLDSVIQLIEKSIASNQLTLDDLQRSANSIYLSQGQEVPGGLAQKIEHFTRKIEGRKSQLELKINEKNKIDQQYELDRARFRELTSETGTQSN